MRNREDTESEKTLGLVGTNNFAEVATTSRERNLKGASDRHKSSQISPGMEAEDHAPSSIDGMVCTDTYTVATTGE